MQPNVGEDEQMFTISLVHVEIWLSKTYGKVDESRSFHTLTL